MADPSAKRSEGSAVSGARRFLATQSGRSLSQPLLREGRFRDVQDIADVQRGRRRGRLERGAARARGGASEGGNPRRDRADAGAASARGARRRAMAGAGVVGAGLHALGPEKKGTETRLLH